MVCSVLVKYVILLSSPDNTEKSREYFMVVVFSNRNVCVLAEDRKEPDVRLI